MGRDHLNLVVPVQVTLRGSAGPVAETVTPETVSRVFEVAPDLVFGEAIPST